MKLFKYKDEKFGIVVEGINFDMIVNVYREKINFFSRKTKYEFVYRHKTYTSFNINRFSNEDIKPYILQSIKLYLIEDTNYVAPYNEKDDLTPSYLKEIISLKNEKLKLMDENKLLSKQINDFEKRQKIIDENDVFIKECCNI